MSNLSNLDHNELMHLALEAAERDDHGSAITYLKQALDLSEGSTATSTDYAKLLYLLGAEYAQIGMVDRAQDHIAQALDMDPALHTARYQLGLLHITSAQPQQALAVLAPLNQLGTGNTFFHLGAGLTQLIQDEFADCRVNLLQALDLNTQSASPNLALNADIQTLLQSLPVPGDATGDTSQAVPAGNAEAGFLMSAYNRGGSAAQS